MGWEQYLSAEKIYNTSSEELEQIKEDLQREMNSQHERFVDYKKWLIDEFESVFTWYKNHYSKQMWLEALEKEFNLKLENSHSIIELVKVIEQITRNADIPIKLRDMLKSKYSRLCLSGKLPRDFIIQVRPLIILETQQACLSFLDKINSVFARAKTQQLEVFETLIRKLSIAENEEEACQFIQESIRVVKSFLDIKSTFTLFDQISNKHLYSIISTLQGDLKKKGYINPANELDFDITSLKLAIDIAEAQIVLKKLNQREQKEQLTLAHKLAFALLKTNAQGNKDIEQYLFEHERSLVVIEETIPADNAQGLMMLRDGYIKFWLHFAHTSLDEMQKNEGKRKKKWRSLLLQMLTARKNLQQQGYLPENFVIDKKYLMMERFENYIHAAYRNTLWTLGDDRVEQINFLRQQLQNTHSEMQAARLIHIAIEDIQQDHQEKSFGFNLAFVKKKSRAAGALQALLRDCEKEGVLPKIAMRHVGPVGQHLAKVVEDYFSAAILFSNRDHRSIAKRLFSAIRLVEDQINEEKILFIDGQQLIADLLEHAIKEVKKMDKQNNLVNKILNYLGSQTNPAFVEYLKRAQTELLLTKKLVESYRYVIWPIVRDKLNSALNTYKNTITPEHDEDKEKGVREANEMIIQLQDATNAEHVCYLLAYGIRSFQTGFPMLAKTLEETYQILRKDGVLPSIPHTEFSETIKKQIKQQTRDITELRARLCKVS